MTLVRAARKLTTARVALLAAVVALVAATCSPAVGMLLPQLTSNRTEDQLGGTISRPASEALAPSELAAEATNPPAAPGDQLSTVVQPIEVPSGQTPPPVSTTALPTFGKVRVHQPRIRVSGLTSPEALKRIRQVQGVALATGFQIGQIPVGAQGKAVTVAAVDPAEFRKMTPGITANKVEVWQRIVEGDAAFTHEKGYELQKELKAELGAFVPAGTEGATLRVGAYASNGAPPVADAIVSPQTASQLGMTGSREALVSLKAGADASTVAQAIARATGSRVSLIQPPQTQRAFLTGEDARSKFEPFSYIDNGDGTIQIDPDWVRRNIVRRPMPLLKGEVICHRMMVDQLYGALNEIQQQGLGHLIDPSQYGGCWVARHIDWSPSRPLSMHAWGLAADFNVSTNGLGMKPQLDPRIVAIFDKWGFVWGGRWSRPDGMHFELGALLQSPQG